MFSDILNFFTISNIYWCVLFFRFSVRLFLFYLFIVSSHRSCTALICILLMAVKVSSKFSLWIMTKRLSHQMRPQVRNFSFCLSKIIFFLCRSCIHWFFIRCLILFLQIMQNNIINLVEIACQWSSKKDYTNFFSWK